MVSLDTQENDLSVNSEAAKGSATRWDVVALAVMTGVIVELTVGKVPPALGMIGPI